MPLDTITAAPEPAPCREFISLLKSPPSTPPLARRQKAKDHPSYLTLTDMECEDAALALERAQPGQADALVCRLRDIMRDGQPSAAMFAASALDTAGVKAGAVATITGEPIGNVLTLMRRGNDYGQNKWDPRNPDTPAQPAAKRKRGLGLLPLAKDTRRPKVRPAICSALAIGEVSALVGAPGAGKSALVQDMALALVHERPDLVSEEKFERIGDVIIVNKEDDYETMLRRRDAFMSEYGLTDATAKHQVHYVADQNFTALRRDDVSVVLTSDMDRLAEQIADLRAADRAVCAVGFDTFPSVCDGPDENSNSDMAVALSLLTSWAVQNKVALFTTGHMQKTHGYDGGAGSLFAIRGAGAIGGGARIAFTLTQVGDDIRAKLPPEIRDDVMVLANAKGSHSKQSQRPRYFWKKSAAITVEYEDGTFRRDTDVVLVPYTLPVGYEPESDNAKHNVLCAVVEAEGDPLRIKGHGPAKSGAALLAEELGAPVEAVEKTFHALERDGLLRRGKGPANKKGRRAIVWLITPKGRECLEAAGVRSETSTEEERTCE